MNRFLAFSGIFQADEDEARDQAHWENHHIYVQKYIK